MEEGIYDSIVFYCPVCKETIYKKYIDPYECGCGKKWKCSPPLDLEGGAVPVMEKNGKIIKE